MRVYAAMLLLQSAMGAAQNLNETDSQGEPTPVKVPGQALESPRNPTPDLARSYFMRPSQQGIPPVLPVDKDKKPTQPKVSQPKPTK